MAFDHVHDLQYVYRKLLDSMSRPGKILSIGEVSDKQDDVTSLNKATYQTAITLLDAEVTYSIISNINQTELTKKITEYTLAKHVPVNQADYIIVLNDAPEATIIHSIELCKNGNLINPEFSSTWIIETTIEKQDQLTLNGPGIQGKSHLQVRLSSNVSNARNKKNEEYPLGIDIIFVDECGQVVCVPRTTTVKCKEGK